MTIFYLDYENGNDSNSGSAWSDAWKTITNGATAARIASGDIIRIAKSPAPTSIGNATWTSASKTVVLETAQTGSICNCESNWTAGSAGDTTPTLVGVATDAKEGSFCVRLTLDASPQINAVQAYFPTGELNLSSYEKISFWIKNSGSILASTWKVNLCSDTAGATAVDTFNIPDIPSTTRWLPLTLAKVGGGTLGASIQSISISTGSVCPTASTNILIDNFLACSASGLSLQSLISKNNLEQGGTEGWFAIQSIKGGSIIIDSNPAAKSNEGQGYSGSSGSALTYKRETIKTSLAPTITTVIQDVQDDYVFFEGGYDPSSGSQNGETFFDGLNGYGYGLRINIKSGVSMNYINAYRYYYGFYLESCSNSTWIDNNRICHNDSSGIYLSNSNRVSIGTFLSADNNKNYGIYILAVCEATINKVYNCNNNTDSGMYINSCDDIRIENIYNANNNKNEGLNFCAANIRVGNIDHADKNGTYGIDFTNSNHVFINSLNTKNNITSSFYIFKSTDNYINNLVAEESIIVTGNPFNILSSLYIGSINGSGSPSIWNACGNIISQNATAGGSGAEWKMNITSAGVQFEYPFRLKVAQAAVAANRQVTASLYMKKSHATDLGAGFACSGSQIAGLEDTIVEICPSDTNRNLVQLIFTPTESGVVEFEAWGWWVANTADENVIVDDFSVIQV